MGPSKLPDPLNPYGNCIRCGRRLCFDNQCQLYDGRIFDHVCLEEYLHDLEGMLRKIRLCFPDAGPAEFSVPRYIIDEIDGVLEIGGIDA